MNLKQIDTEMKYNPPWYKDKRHFRELWNAQYVTDHYLIILARLYARYSHMDQSLILHCLDAILKKFGLIDKQSLFRKTQSLYSQGYRMKEDKTEIY